MSTSIQQRFTRVMDAFLEPGEKERAPYKGMLAHRVSKSVFNSLYFGLMACNGKVRRWVRLQSSANNLVYPSCSHLRGPQNSIQPSQRILSHMKHVCMLFSRGLWLSLSVSCACMVDATETFAVCLRTTQNCVLSTPTGL